MEGEGTAAEEDMVAIGDWEEKLSDEDNLTAVTAGKKLIAILDSSE